MKRKLDSTDLEILRILSKEGKIQNVGLSKKMHIAPSATLNRVKRLEKENVIQSYHARLDYEVLDRNFVAFISIKTNGQSSAQKIGSTLSKIPAVQELYQTAGEHCFLAKVRTSSTKDLAELINDRISIVAGVASTSTMIALRPYREAMFVEF